MGRWKDEYNIHVPETRPKPLALTTTDVGETLRWTQVILDACTQLESVAVYTWGDGRDGALAHGHSRVVKEPKAVSGLRNEQICAVSAGWKVSLFLTDQGQVFQSGKVAPNASSGALTPELVTLPTVIHSVAAGVHAAFAVARDGRAYSWGIGLHGQLGHGRDGQDDTSVSSPRVIQALEEHDVVKISAGIYFAVALTSRGRVFAWGKSHADLPESFRELDEVYMLDIAAGDAHVLAFGESETLHNGRERSVWAWGKNTSGCMGVCSATIRFSSSPLEVVSMRGHYIEKLAAGSDHSLILTCSGIKTYVFAFGSNTFGQLGTEGTDSYEIPRQIRELNGVRVIAIAAGSRFSVAIASDGQVYSWGDAAYNKTCQDRITFVPWLSTALQPFCAVAVAAGKDHTILLARKDSTKMTRFRQFVIEKQPPTPAGRSNQMLEECCPHTGMTLSFPCSLLYWCKTCDSTLCRSCARYCHSGHDISMRFIGESTTKTGAAAGCACTVPNPHVLDRIVEE